MPAVLDQQKYLSVIVVPSALFNLIGVYGEYFRMRTRSFVTKISFVVLCVN
jgi:hypothetical protein